MFNNTEFYFECLCCSRKCISTEETWTHPIPLLLNNRFIPYLGSWNGSHRTPCSSYKMLWILYYLDATKQKCKPCDLYKWTFPSHCCSTLCRFREKWVLYITGGYTFSIKWHKERAKARIKICLKTIVILVWQSSSRKSPNTLNLIKRKDRKLNYNLNSEYCKMLNQCIFKIVG